MNSKNDLNYKVIITSMPIFILTIAVRLALGHLSILIFDLVYIITIYTLVILYKKKGYEKALNMSYILHLTLPILALLLPFLENKDRLIKILGIVTYLIPVILNFIMVYLKSKIKN